VLMGGDSTHQIGDKQRKFPPGVMCSGKFTRMARGGGRGKVFRSGLVVKNVAAEWSRRASRREEPAKSVRGPAAVSRRCLPSLIQ